MNNIEKWNEIVRLFDQNSNSREEIIQKTWEDIFSEFFNYRRLQGEIDSQRSIQIGSTERVITDIIIKDGSKDLFVVELKQHSLNTGETQLFSYLKQLKVDVGILINNKITIYDFNYLEDDNNQKKYTFEFIKDSFDGEKFIEIFSKPFNVEKFHEFIRLKNNKQERISEIKKMIKSDYLYKILKEDLKKSFDDDEIEEAIEDYTIEINKKNINTFKRTDYREHIYIDTASNKNDDNYLKGVKKISLWANKPGQYNHKIIRAFLQLENDLGEVRLHNLANICSSKEKYPNIYVPTFGSNYSQMKFDGPKSHGKIFEERYGVVTIWERARDEIEKYRKYFEE